MSSRRKLKFALAVLASTVGLGARGAGASKTVKPTLSCKLDLTTQWYGDVHGKEKAALNCNAPFGRGVERDSYSAKVTTNTWVVTATFTESFAAGTLFGKFKASMIMKSPDPPDSYTFAGPMTYRGGTGAYRDVKQRPGPSIIACISLDVGRHLGCSVAALLAGV
jgi:hypothetical protein